MKTSFGALLLLSLSSPVAGCGPAAAPVESPPAVPEASREAPPSLVRDEEWASACAGDRAGRVGRIRKLAERDARARGDDEGAAALARWQPPGRGGAAPTRQAASHPPHPAVIRAVTRMVQVCGSDEATSLTTSLVAFQTVAAIAPPAESPPFIAMAEFLERWAKESGLGWAISGPHDAYEITLRGTSGRRDRSVVLVAHGDVVPVNEPPAASAPGVIPSGWSFAPFEATVRGGRLLGRGTEDDKGPIASSMVAMAALREAGIAPEDDVVLVIGTAEEFSWKGMQRYAAQAPPARSVISVDADYPVVVAESGFVAWGVRAPLGKAPKGGKRPAVVDLRGGLFLTQVPGEAQIALEPRGEKGVSLLARAQKAAEAEALARRGEEKVGPYTIDVAIAPAEKEKGSAERVIVRVAGASVHSSVAEQGHNALWPLAKVAQALDVAPGGVRTILDVVANEFDGDHYGERLGVGYAVSLMGRLVVAPTLLRAEGGWVSLGVNMRRPRGKTSDEFRKSLDGALAKLRARYGGALEATPDVWVGDPHVADTSGPLTGTLLDIFRRTMGLPDAGPVSVRGGTYARLFEGAVSFGPNLPGRPYRGHAADEYIELEALHRTTEMLLEALVRLAVPGGSGQGR